ncbi:MAG: hypothetical protein KKD48_04195 [Nanoarchaeota archaeon]|nr:hypothetical protein [Nanoarchaeota archaeon]
MKVIKMEDKLLKEVIELNKNIKDIISKNSKEYTTIKVDTDFDIDNLKTNFKLSTEQITEILIKGLHLEDKHLYENPNEKNPKKNFYCIYEDKKIILCLQYFLISYYMYNQQIKLFHLQHINKNSREGKRYNEIKEKLKGFSL